MNSGSVLALLILFYVVTSSKLEDVLRRLKKLQKNIQGRRFGLSYDGLEFPDGPVPALNLWRYHAALVSHEASTAGWLEVNPHLEEPELSRRDEFKFWCREHYATARNWMLFLLGCTIVTWLVQAIWPLVAQFLFPAYDYNTGNAVPHHTPHLVMVLGVVLSVALVVVGAVTLAMELAGRMSATMTKWCEWETRENDIAFHEEKLRAVRQARSGAEQDLADLKALSQA